MLAVWLFVALFVVLALIIFFIAVRGGPGAARAALQSQRPGARKTATVLFAIAFVGFGVAMPVGFLIGNHANADSHFAGLKLTPAEKRGQMVFGQNCGVCHTLAAANTVGKVGPNLDQIRPNFALVVHTIVNGCLQNPPTAASPQTCLGQGVMPAAIIRGQDVQQVAAFVAKFAGTQ